MWYQKGVIYPVLHCFVLCHVLSTRSKIRFVYAVTTTRQSETPPIAEDPKKSNDRPPGYWPRYSGTRRVRLLDGTWNASFLESQNRVHWNGESADLLGMTNSRFDSMDPNIDISKINTTEHVTIPSTIEVIADPEHGYLPGYMGYRGVSFFRTHFETNGVTERSTSQSPSRMAARIQFQACSFYCRVWLNGVEIGDHIGGGYVAWWLDVSDKVLELGQELTQLPKSREEMRSPVLIHELFVLVDNRFNSTTAPLHTGGDFWHYGGIMRSVEWHDRPNTNLPEAKVEQSSKEENKSTNDDIHSRGYSGVDSFVKSKEYVHNVSATVSSTRFRKRALKRDILKQGSPLSNVWPWRLYIVPKKDLRSVELSLQLVGEDDDVTRDRTHTDIVNELRKNGCIKIYFDGNVTKNALDDHFLTTDTIHLEAVSYSTDIMTPSGRGNDRLVKLGTFSVPNPRIWSTTDPQLHTISVDMNGAIVTERFGLRFWDTGMISHHSTMWMPNTKSTNNFKTSNTTTSNKIRLNGKVLKLMGWNHHTQWPYTAASPTDEQLDEDIRLLKESGHANFVRGAHYPQDPRWLDRLDEHGIVVWCETLGPAVSVANLQDEYFLKAQNQQMNEMLDNAFNHASIAFWGFFNEGPSNHEESCAGYQASFDAIQARDTTRFITYASDRRPPSDKCYKAATVISYNGYPGWYQKQDPEDYWNSLASELSSGTYPNALGKPLIISETGAGGIYEWKQNETAEKWTLGYQTDIVSRDVATAIENANISGIALWHFFDFKVDDKWENNTHCDYLPGVEPKTCGFIDAGTSGKKWGQRPGGANHKGSLDFFRRPKPIFSVVASQYEIMNEQQKHMRRSKQ